MFKFLKRPLYLSALKNAINAKITISELDIDTKMQVYLYANALYVTGGKVTSLESALEKIQKNKSLLESSLNRMSEFELNTLYSMALIELEIEPSLFGEGWDVPPRNPFSISSEIDKTDVINAVSWFKDKHGIDVSIQLKSNDHW